MGLVFNGTSGTDKISAVDGTLTIDGVATINSITSPIITGDLSISDTIVHTGDTNTKIRFPSADTITAEVGGSEITRVTSSGLGINVTPNRELHVKGLDAIVRVESTSATGRNVIEFFDSSAAKGSIGWPASGNDHMAIQQSENADMWFSTNDTERLRITSAGKLLIGTTTASGYGNRYLTIASGADTALEIRSSTSQYGYICFSDSTAADANSYRGLIAYNHSNNSIHISTDATERLRIDSSGRLLVGHNVSDPMFYTGRIQVQGTNSSTSAITVKTNQNDSGGPAIVLGKSRGSVGTQTIVQSGDELGAIYWNGADGTDTNSYAAAIRCHVDGTPGSNDMPGRLVFLTTADGAATSTERLRIASNGAIGLSGTNYGSSGQVLTSQGSGAAPQWATASSGGWTVHKDATTAFSNALIEQTSGLSASTDVIQIIAYKLRAGNGSGTDICVQLGTSGGYGGTYNGMQRYFNSSGSQETNQNHDQSMWSAWHGQGNPFSQTNTEYSGTLTITRMGGNNFVMESQSLCDRTDNNTQYLLINAGRAELGGALTKIKIYTESGNNFSHGNITIRSM